MTRACANFMFSRNSTHLTRKLCVSHTVKTTCGKHMENICKCMEKQRMENTVCKCKNSCSTKRKSADSNCGCPCKARNTECSAECRCGARSKPCINKVLYIRVTIIYLPISNVELGILSQNICVFFPNQDNAHLLAEERGLRRRNPVRFGSDSSHAATEEEDRRREHNDVKVYYS